MSGLRERVAEIVREAMHAGFQDGTRANFLRPDPPSEHYADRILALLQGEEEPVAYRVRNSPTVEWGYHEDQYGPGEMARILREITPEDGEVVPLFTRPEAQREARTDEEWADDAEMWSWSRARLIDEVRKLRGGSTQEVERLRAALRQIADTKASKHRTTTVMLQRAIEIAVSALSTEEGCWWVFSGSPEGSRRRSGSCGRTMAIENYPRLRGHLDILRNAREALDQENGEIDEFLRGPWYPGISAEADRRRAIAHQRFGYEVAHVASQIPDAVLAALRTEEATINREET